MKITIDLNKNNNFIRFLNLNQIYPLLEANTEKIEIDDVSKFIIDLSKEESNNVDFYFYRKRIEFITVILKKIEEKNKLNEEAAYALVKLFNENHIKEKDFIRILKRSDISEKFYIENFEVLKKFPSIERMIKKSGKTSKEIQLLKELSPKEKFDFSKKNYYKNLNSILEQPIAFLLEHFYIFNWSYIFSKNYDSGKLDNLPKEKAKLFFDTLDIRQSIFSKVDISSNLKKLKFCLHYDKPFTSLFDFSRFYSFVDEFFYPLLLLFLNDEELEKIESLLKKENDINICNKFFKYYCKKTCTKDAENKDELVDELIRNIKKFNENQLSSYAKNELKKELEELPYLDYNIDMEFLRKMKEIFNIYAHSKEFKSLSIDAPRVVKELLTAIFDELNKA